MAGPLDSFLGGMPLPPLTFASPADSKTGDITSIPAFNSSGWNVNFKGTQITSGSGGGQAAGGAAGSVLVPAVLTGLVAFLAFRMLR